jgi:hypothetical protein
MLSPTSPQICVRPALVCAHSLDPTPGALCQNPHLSERLSTYAAAMLTRSRAAGPPTPQRFFAVCWAPVLCPMHPPACCASGGGPSTSAGGLYRIMGAALLRGGATCVSVWLRGRLSYEHRLYGFLGSPWRSGSTEYRPSGGCTQTSVGYGCRHAAARSNRGSYVMAEGGQARLSGWRCRHLCLSWW